MGPSDKLIYGFTESTSVGEVMTGNASQVDDASSLGVGPIPLIGVEQQILQIILI